MIVHVHTDITLSAMVGINAQASSVATQLAVRAMVVVKNHRKATKGYELIQRHIIAPEVADVAIVVPENFVAVFAFSGTFLFSTTHKDNT